MGALRLKLTSFCARVPLVGSGSCSCPTRKEVDLVRIKHYCSSSSRSLSLSFSVLPGALGDQQPDLGTLSGALRTIAMEVSLLPNLGVDVREKLAAITTTLNNVATLIATHNIDMVTMATSIQDL